MTKKDTPKPPPSSRTRDSDATRQAILQAAQQVFMAKGFDAAGVREIATRAGANVALINRYFGSKEQLFFAAISDQDHLAPLLAEGKDGFGLRLASYMANKHLSDGDLDPTQVFVRSIGSVTVGPALSEATQTQHIAALADWLGGENAEERAAMIMAELLGFDMLRRIAGIDAFNRPDNQALITYFARAVQGHVDG